MPAFIKTPADEKKWNAIKHSVAKQRGKKIDDFTDRDWATVNAAWHKSEGNQAEYDKIMKSLFISPSSGGMLKTGSALAKPPKMGLSTAVKSPKPKKMADPFGKPSLFFKSEPEEFAHVKHPTLQKLRDFLMKKHKAQ